MRLELFSVLPSIVGEPSCIPTWLRKVLGEWLLYATSTVDFMDLIFFSFSQYVSH